MKRAAAAAAAAAPAVPAVPSVPAVPYAATLHIRDACLCLHVQRAARALARRFDEALRPVGLTNGQFSLLMSLNRPQPASMASVAALLAMDRTTLTAALKTLERRKLVAVCVSPDDARRRLLTLTPPGARALAAALPIWQREHGAVEAGLRSKQRPVRLRRDLRTLSG